MVVAFNVFTESMHEEEDGEGSSCGLPVNKHPHGKGCFLGGITIHIFVNSWAESRVTNPVSVDILEGGDGEG